MFKAFLDLLYPHLCPSCEVALSNFEPTICEFCTHILPQTNFHTLETNPLDYFLQGRCQYHHISAFLFFIKDGRVQNLLHNIKYQNKPKLAEFIGEWYGKILLNDGYLLPDVILPIPLHKSKLKTRGYNQSEHFALGLSKSWGNIEVHTSFLVKNKITESQTLKNKFERFINTSSNFEIDKNFIEHFQNKKILLVDDVITTGATLESAVDVLNQANPELVNILAIAVAQ